MEGRFRLERSSFEHAEKTVLEFESIRAVSFLYPSGVQALRIENDRGHIIVLPFQGQQIWDAVFDGRSLKMVNFFDQPRDTEVLVDSYGPFLFHCGALRMGAPGPDDSHPLHGELPGAHYDEAWMLFGEDEEGPYAGLTGVYRYQQAFGSKYEASPHVKMRPGSSVLDVEICIENMANKPMELMYMCHVNFFPADNAEIIQPTGWTSNDMEVRSSIPSHVTPTPEFLEFLDSLKRNPDRTRVLRPEDTYDPEIVFFVRNLRSDNAGNTHLLQKHIGGFSDYISYNVNDLNHTVRWILSHEDQKVNGMALPATCGPEGYHREKEKGNVRQIEGKNSKSFSVKVGALDAPATTEMEKRIESLK